MSLPARALRTIRKHQLFPRGARVLVAVSGGADSVSLLHILRVLERRGELAIAGVGHLNHLLRGPDADADEQFCCELAATAGLPFESARVDVAALARAAGCSLESGARRARYEFLNGAAARLQAEAVAVGHTLDDQAETVLLRLARGAGSRGIAGIRPKAGTVVRPLLDISRAELRAYTAVWGLASREDSSNADVAIPRNRLRLEVMPHLERFAPAIVRTLAREAALARDDEDYLDGRATEVFPSVVLQSERGTELRAEALRTLPRPLASRVVRRVLEESAPGRFVAAGHVDGVLELAGAPNGTSVALPGLVATREQDYVLLGSGATAAFPQTPCLPLTVPGGVELGRWAITAEAADVQPTPPVRGAVALVAADVLRLPLAVRTRRRGDRFRPLGMAGRGRKLQDFLVDRKVARAERDALPLVVDRDDRIVWVAGQSVAEDFRVTAACRAVILLKARRLGGPG